MYFKIDPIDAFVIASVSSIVTLCIQKMIAPLQDRWYDFYNYYVSFDPMLTDIIDKMLIEFGDIRGIEIINEQRVPCEGKTHIYYFDKNNNFISTVLPKKMTNQYAGFIKIKKRINGRDQYVYEAWTAPISREKLYNCINDFLKTCVNDNLAICYNSNTSTQPMHKCEKINTHRQSMYQYEQVD